MVAGLEVADAGFLEGELMQALLDAVADLVALVSPTKVWDIASALRGISSPADAPNADPLIGAPIARASVVRLFKARAHTPASGDEIAGMLLGASAARQVERELNVELVWTKPTTRFVATCCTEQILLLDLIRGTGTDLLPVSFVSFPTSSRR